MPLRDLKCLVFVYQLLEIKSIKRRLRPAPLTHRFCALFALLGRRLCTPLFKDRCSWVGWLVRKTLRNGSLRRWSALAQGACFELSIQRVEANALRRFVRGDSKHDCDANACRCSGHPRTRGRPPISPPPSKKRFGQVAAADFIRQRRPARIAISRRSCAWVRHNRRRTQHFFIARAFRAFPVEPGLAVTTAGGVGAAGAGPGCTEAAAAVGPAAGEGVEGPVAGAAVTGVRLVVSMGSVLFECSKRRRRDDPGWESALHRPCRIPRHWPNGFQPNPLCQTARTHHSRSPALASPTWAIHAPVGLGTCNPRNDDAVNPESLRPRLGVTMNLPRRGAAK